VQFLLRLFGSSTNVFGDAVRPRFLRSRHCYFNSPRRDAPMFLCDLVGGEVATSVFGRTDSEQTGL
jgi:hypothetical protein